MLNITIEKQSDDAFVLAIDGERTQTLTRAQIDEIYNEAERIDIVQGENFDELLEGKNVRNLVNDTYRLPFLANRYDPRELADFTAHYNEHVKGYINFVAQHERTKAEVAAAFATIDKDLGAAE